MPLAVTSWYKASVGKGGKVWALGWLSRADWTVRVKNSSIAGFRAGSTRPRVRRGVEAEEP